MSLIELTLTGIAFGGDAVGRHAGQVIFVPYGIPGERVRIRLTQNKGRFARGQVVEVLEMAPARREAPCPHFGHCGGCHYQHIDQEAQLAFKQQVVKDQLGRIGGLREALVHPTIPSPHAYYYRSHVTFQIDSNNRPAFVAAGDDRRLLPIDTCLLMRPELQACFGALRVTRRPERIRLQIGSSGEPISFWMGAGAGDEEAPPTDTDQAVFYTVKGRQFRCSAGSFFQVNLPQAEVLVDCVMNRVEPYVDGRLLDLYSGVGLFTAFLSERAKTVDAVESGATAVADARINLIDYAQVRLHQGTAEHILPTLSGKFDAAVVDPPRAGLHPQARTALINLQPERVVYVSCDPATLARDAKELTAAGYRLLDAQPVDMFPQTYHIETVATFTR